jgi:hypothetical protein
MTLAHSFTTPNLLFAPIPLDPYEAARWMATSLRRRLLYGAWRDDLANHIVARVGKDRAQAWGAPDMSANPFRSLCQQVAVLYDEPPIISHPDDPGGTAAALLTSALETAGAWSLMARVQRDTVGMREMLVRVDIDEDTGELVLRPVHPDFVCARPHPTRPDAIAAIKEARLRQPEGSVPQAQFWAWDCLDPKRLEYRVTDDHGADVTESELGAPASGKAYPYVYDDGAPYLPYALYHAAQTGCLWDPYEGIELVDGTLNVGGHWTFWNHCVEDASWPQRYAAGWEVVTTEAVGDPAAPRLVATVDPAVLLQLRSNLDAGQGLIGQWAPGADPSALADAISAYERRLAAYAGLSPSDFARISGDPRSGYALAISREGQREAARRLEPQFRRGDVQLLSICAAQLNRWHERHSQRIALPEKGWRIRYQALPPSPQELESKRRNVLELMDAGLMSAVEAYMELHPGLSEAEAKRAITKIRRDQLKRAEMALQMAPPEPQEGGNEPENESDEAETTENAGGSDG